MLNEVKSRKAGRKIISFMHISLAGYVAGPNGEISHTDISGISFQNPIFI